MSSPLIGAMTGVEMECDMMTLMCGIPGGICSVTCRSSVTMATIRMEMVVTQGVMWRKASCVRMKSISSRRSACI